MTADKNEATVDFSGLVLGLCSAALSYLGYGDEEQSLCCNLALARQNIDIIQMLQDKTKGNLTSEEQILLSQVLHDLHLKYVEAAR